MLEDSCRSMGPAWFGNVLQLHVALKSLSAEFDYIVVNSPPMSLFVDAAILSHVADKILLVVRWKDTPQEIVQRAARQLFEVNARVGVVLNLIHPGRHRNTTVTHMCS